MLPAGHTDDAYRECLKRDQFHNRSGAGGGLAFIHIPKAAGTLIEDIAMKQGVRWGRRCLYGMQQMPDGYYCSRHHVPPQLLPHLYHGLETFCVTRHPYERAVSEYRYLLSVPWGKDQKPGLYDHEPCSQEGLNHFIQTGLELAKRFRMFGIIDGHTDGYKYVNDCHMLPQADYIWGRQRHGWSRRLLGAGAERVYCHHPLRMEKLEEDFNQLMEAKGYPFRLGDTSRRNTFEETCPHLSVQNLSQETRAIIQNVYTDDFRRFGYCTQCM